MLGHSHATSGALAWSAAAVALPLTILTYPAATAGAHLGTVELLLGTFLTAGAALLPDADHPKGSIAHVLGPISYVACKIISKISGGHRHATHSLAFVVAITVATWAGVHWLGRPFTLGLVFFLLALAVRALHLCPGGDGVQSWGTVAVLAIAGTFVMDYWLADKPSWLPFAVGLGSLAHILGDCLTERGCPLFWPFGTRVRVPVIERTGNWIETWFISPLFVLATMAVLRYAITRRP